jgi:hypothetical protein
MPRAATHVEDPYFVKAASVGEHAVEPVAAVVSPPAPQPPPPEPALGSRVGKAAQSPGRSECGGRTGCPEPPPLDPSRSGPAEEEVASKEPASKKSKSVHKKAHHGIRAPSTSQEGTHLLARAEELARKGQTDAALEIYQRIRDDDRAELLPYRPVASYETARLYGFVLKRAGVAEQMFRDLARMGTGEVSTQAGFALCELDLAHDRCLAAQCLRRMADGSSAEVDAEARQLLGRWGLDATSLSQCP